MTPPVDPGELSVRLELQEPDETPDAMGGFADGWSVRARVWARIAPIGASAGERGAATLQSIGHEITIRKTAGVRPGMRFRKGLRIFVIETVADPDETGRYLACRTREEALV